MTGTYRHTPGQWFEDPFGLDIDVACNELRGGPGYPASGWTAVAIRYGEDDPGGAGDEHVAYCHPDNAAIIAAAPDMLAALKTAKRFVGAYQLLLERGKNASDARFAGESFDECARAIAKAEGRDI